MSQERRVDLEEIRALTQLATEADITELDVDAPHVKVRIKKAGRNSAERAAAIIPRPDGATPQAASQGHLIPIVARPSWPGPWTAVVCGLGLGCCRPAAGRGWRTSPR